MDSKAFFAELDRRITGFDLLCHPFYQAWGEGKLTRDDLREYAGAYYPHVAAFPEYLEALRDRLADDDTRQAVSFNLDDELGLPDGRPHHELWLDFAAGMGADREQVRRTRPIPAVAALVHRFFVLASESTPGEALAAFYAYESQVPRVAAAKEKGLKEWYGADRQTAAYFTLHKTADVYHAQVWRGLLERELEAGAVGEPMLAAAENAARCLWEALDGIERERQARHAA